MTEIRPHSPQDHYLVIDEGIIEGATITVKHALFSDEWSVWLDRQDAMRAVTALMAILEASAPPEDAHPALHTTACFEELLERVSVLEELVSYLRGLTAGMADLIHADLTPRMTLVESRLDVIKEMKS